MKTKGKWIVAILSLVIFITTVSIMIWLATKTTEYQDNYKHIGYLSWLNDQTSSGQTYSQFKMDVSSGNILATSKENGTYIIDSSPSIINQITQVNEHGQFTSDIMRTIDNATFGNIFKENKEISIGLWAALIIISTVSTIPFLYILRGNINKKTGA